MTLATQADLERAMRALNGIPGLTEDERARIFAAMDAPHGSHKAAWLAVKELDLAHGETVKPYPLSAACQWWPWPTAEQIIAGLQYAAGVLA